MEDIEVHSADGAFPGIVSNVHLGYRRLKPMFLELFLAKRTSEISARVFPALDIDNESAFELGLREDHSNLRCGSALP